MRENRIRLQLWMPVTLILLVCGCTSKPVSLPLLPVAIPELPIEARQPSAPLWCSPTCSSGLIKERESWQRLMTGPK